MAETPAAGTMHAPYHEEGGAPHAGTHGEGAEEETFAETEIESIDDDDDDDEEIEGDDDEGYF